MAKKYYEILEISENATAEEVKKAYRKLALEWHPDKWMSKSSEKKEEANKKMREINKAFEILGDEELKRKYDNGEEFASDFGGYEYEEMIKEEARKKEEELRKAKEEVIDIELEILKLEMKSLDRSSAINEIRLAFFLTFPRVFEENLDSKLWEDYQDWMEKVVKMEITIPKGKERSEELKEFKEEMFKAIKEAENVLESKEREKRGKRKEKIGSRIKQEVTSAIEEIEGLVIKKGLKSENLGEYSNYEKKISELDKVWKIRDLRDEIIEFINNKKDIEEIDHQDNLRQPPYQSQQKLTEELTKKDKLEKLKDEFAEKRLDSFLNILSEVIKSKKKKVEEIKKNLEIYLASIDRQGNLAELVQKYEKEYLLKGEKENSELAELLEEITSLKIQQKLEVQKTKEQSQQIVVELKSHLS